jgi:hypothetical protein
MATSTETFGYDRICLHYPLLIITPFKLGVHDTLPVLKVDQFPNFILFFSQALNMQRDVGQFLF